MYNEHEHLEAVLDDIVLWKYMDFLKFVNILTTNKIWFNKINCFEDVYEGTYPVANKALRDKIYNGAPPPQCVYDTAEKYERQRLYVLCFHNNEYESAAMWNLYANDAGIAIKTSGNRLKKCFNNESKNIYIAPVDYIDYEKDFLPEGNAFYLGTHKRKSFSHEKEIRCMYFNTGDALDDKGQYINVDVTELIEEIYISPYAPEYMADTLKALLKKYGYHIPITKSPLYRLNK